MTAAHLSNKAKEAVTEFAQMSINHKNKDKVPVTHLPLNAFMQFVLAQTHKFKQQKREVIQMICAKSFADRNYLQSALKSMSDASAGSSKWFKQVILSHCYLDGKDIALTLDLHYLYSYEQLADEVLLTFLSHYEKSAHDLNLPASMLFTQACLICADLLCIEQQYDKALMYYYGVKQFFEETTELTSAALYGFAKYFLKASEVNACDSYDDNLHVAIVYFINEKIRDVQDLQQISSK